MRWAILIVGLMLSACAGATKPPSLSEAPVYRLGAGDTLKITVFGEDNLGGEFKVDGRGFVVFPLVGEVAAADLAVSEFQASLASALSNGFLQEPNVVVELATARPIYILGEVENAGEYPYVEAMTVMQAIAKAGGYTYRANRSRVFVLRSGEMEEIKYELSPSMRIGPGDTIRIPERLF